MRSKEEIAYRTGEARRLLDEPLLNEALDAIEQAAYNELLQCDRADDDGRRIMADRIRTIRGIRGQLRAIIAGGENALRPTRNVA